MAELKDFKELSLDDSPDVAVEPAGPQWPFVPMLSEQFLDERWDVYLHPSTVFKVIDEALYQVADWSNSLSHLVQGYLDAGIDGEEFVDGYEAEDVDGAPDDELEDKRPPKKQRRGLSIQKSEFSPIVTDFCALELKKQPGEIKWSDTAIYTLQVLAEQHIVNLFRAADRLREEGILDECLEPQDMRMIERLAQLKRPRNALARAADDD